MKVRNLNTFGEEIKTTYKKDGYLLLPEPTPLSIKKRVLFLIENSLIDVDYKIITSFLNIVDDSQNLIQTIKGLDVGVFKPIQNFLTKNQGLRYEEGYNFVAWLIDFKPRPYSYYLENNSHLNKEDKQVNGNSNKEDKEESSIKEKIVVLKKEDKSKQHWVITFFAFCLVVITISGFYFFNQKGDTSINIDKVETNNDFRQIYPTQNTRFFAEDNAPLVWYASHNNKLDFYNQNEHPVTKEVFEPITREIIKTVFIEENIIPVKIDPKVQVDSTPYLLNTSFKNLPNKKQLSIFIVDSTYQIDRDILDTVKNQCINKGYSITPPLVPFNKLSRNVISQLENLNSEYFKADFQKYTDYLCIGTRQYKYSKSPISAGLVVCELSINYSIISTKTSEEIDYYSKIISGTGFSKSKAKQNAIKKHSL